MKIKYPALVEDAYKTLRKRGVKFSKEQVYKKLVESGMINEDATPTQMAIDEGLVKEIEVKVDPDDPTNYIQQKIAEFKLEYPQFMRFGNEHFSVYQGEVTCDEHVIKTVANETINDSSETMEHKAAAQQMLNWIEDRS